MSNNVHNLVEVHGPHAQLTRFLHELVSIDPRRDPLDVHVPLADWGSGPEAWGTRGTKWVFSMDWEDDHVLLHFVTHWSTPFLWVERVGASWPQLELRLFCGSNESAFGGHIRVRGGQVRFSERIEAGFGPFFARHGRPGFFVPYWEDEEGNDLYGLREPRLEQSAASAVQDSDDLPF